MPKQYRTFYFYKEYLDLVNELPEEHRAEFLFAIIQYGQEGKYTLSTPILKAAFMQVKASIDNSSPSEQSSYTQEQPKYQVPIWIKQNLTLEETAALFGIGINRIREITNEKDCDSVLFVGSRRLIKREKFAAFLESSYSL